jgi:hypothetical protein
MHQIDHGVIAHILRAMLIIFQGKYNVLEFKFHSPSQTRTQARRRPGTH